MSRIIVFDANETLLDVSAMEPRFIRIFGEPSALRIPISRPISLRLLPSRQ